MPVISMLTGSSRLIFSVVALAGALRAADSVPATSPPPDTETHKLEGIFNTDLPKTERKGSVRIIVHPHFGDFTSRSYVRIPTGFRWGVSERAEITATVEPFVAHGLRGGRTDSGLGDFELGGKYQFKRWPTEAIDTSVGFNVFVPVGHPPVDMTTGYNRYSPYVVVGRRIEGHPGLSVFCNAGLNLLTKSSVAGSFEKNQAHSTSLVVTPGFVYDRFPFHYTCEVALETTSLVGRDNQQFVTLRPGFAWDLPPALKFHATGRWVVGFGFHVTIGPDGTSTGGGGKVRAEFGFKRWLQQR